MGTIHGARVKITNQDSAAAPAATDIVEIQDNYDNVSMLTSKTTSKGSHEVAVGSRVASGSNPVSGPTANSTQSGTASGGSNNPASTGPAGGAIGRPDGK
jgi:hypothetical protein